MCIWLPLLFMIGSAILGWLIGKGALAGKVEELEKDVKIHKKQLCNDLCYKSLIIIQF